MRRAPDVKHYQLAQQLRRTIVTMDRDYLDDRRFPPCEGAGVLVVQAPDERQLSSLLDRVAPTCCFIPMRRRIPSHCRSPAASCQVHSATGDARPNDASASNCSEARAVAVSVDDAGEVAARAVVESAADLGAARSRRSNRSIRAAHRRRHWASPAASGVVRRRAAPRRARETLSRFLHEAGATPSGTGRGDRGSVDRRCAKPSRTSSISPSPSTRPAASSAAAFR